MDPTLEHSEFTGKSLNPNTLGNWATVRPVVMQPRACSTQVDVLAQDSTYFMSRGIKRKWVDLSLGLGNSLSSSDSSKQSMGTCCTLSSAAKDRDDGSSIDLDLNFQFSLCNEGTSKLGTDACNVKRALEKQPVMDLNLSLNLGPSESVVTDVDLNMIAQDHTVLLQSCDMASLPTADEGSTSAHWKSGGKLLPYLLPDSSNQSHGLVPLPSPVQVPKSPTACSSEVVGPQQRCTSTKICSQPGCFKGARGSSGRCIAHGGGRRCQREGCKRGAEGKTIFCKAHGGGRRCEHLGCTKSAEGHTDFCIAHGGGRRCSHEGCKRAARGKSGLCIKHGGGKRCQKENCTKSAEGQSGFCIAHEGGRRCKHEGCTKGAQGSTNFCKSHGGGKRCTHLNCSKGAEGSTLFCKGHGGGKRCSAEVCPKSVHGGTQFCVAHGGGKRCVVPGCSKSARGRTDCCVRHGGGKRCQFAGCSKSAQGSTDFCKAHGGGKRCLCGQPGSDLGAGSAPCEHFSRGKNGLCVAHNALVEDSRVRGGRTLGAIGSSGFAMNSAVNHGAFSRNTECRAFNSLNFGERASNAIHPAEALPQVPISAPEGRVRGGNIVAMLDNGINLGKQLNYNVEASTSTQNWP
uniref:WRKY19-like zinc finger domain-containing protein n=1 Tax=Arundo donax TaxID=35708 RepID=A0A0A9FL10_ARUDO